MNHVGKAGKIQIAAHPFHTHKFIRGSTAAAPFLENLYLFQYFLWRETILEPIALYHCNLVFDLFVTIALA